MRPVPIRRRRRIAVFSVLTAVAAALVPLAAPQTASAATVSYPGLTATPVLTGLPTPVAFRFAPDGKIFVANKRGDVQLFDGAGDTTPVSVLDLRREVYDHGDRGLLGIALDPAFATGRPYLYALYSYDKDPFGAATVPRWGGATGGDGCPGVPGENTDGCVSSGRLERFTIRADGTADLGSRLLLLDGADTTAGGWCQQFPSHSIGMVDFGRDGQLYVGAGDGASYTATDWGQFGGSQAGTPTPANPCADRPGTRGAALTATTSRGGALRSQSVRGANATGYVSWDGSILRVNPDSGAASAGNPLLNNGIAGDDRIVAYGLRNPYRFSFRPGTDQLWLGDVGWNTYEEVNQFTTGPGQATVPNFGWPCYEGPNRQSGYDGANISLCENLYTTNTQSLGGVSSPLAAPLYAWPRSGAQPAPGCQTGGGGSATGGQFVTSTSWPSALQGAYVFADYARSCIAALPLTNGQPDVSKRVSLVTGSPAVFLQNGPGNDLYWIDIGENSIQRLRSTAANVPPVARFTATPDSGPTPLAVQFDASATTDANTGEVITYTWDLDGDGACDDATGVRVSRTYSSSTDVQVKLCATDQLGEQGTTTRRVQAGNLAPVITSMTSTADAAGWKVADAITLNAEASDEAGPLADSAFTWKVDVRHCSAPGDETACHTHPLESIPAGRTSSITAPDHDWYAYLRVTLTVTDPAGGVSTRVLDVKPRASTVQLTTTPAGIPVTVGSASGASPRTGSFLENGVAQLIVPATATVGGTGYEFTGWSDGSTAGPQRTVRAAAGATSFTAQYRAVPNTNTPPAVSAVTLSPTSIATGPGTVNVTVTARVTDNAGVSTVRAVLRAPNGTERSATLSRSAGSATDGTYRGTVGIPYPSPGGTWTSSVTATDAANATGSAAGPNLQVRARSCFLIFCV